MGELLHFADALVRPVGRRALIQQLAADEQELLGVLRRAHSREAVVQAATAALTAERADKVTFWVEIFDRRSSRWRAIVKGAGTGVTYHSADSEEFAETGSER